eukprot:Hpha_TRINITY_DN9320_c0_g1::TRINITY_DN9320_c0_g1_i1::g.26106::m.26106
MLLKCEVTLCVAEGSTAAFPPPAADAGRAAGAGGTKRRKPGARGNARRAPRVGPAVRGTVGVGGRRRDPGAGLSVGGDTAAALPLSAAAGGGVTPPDGPASPGGVIPSRCPPLSPFLSTFLSPCLSGAVAATVGGVTPRRPADFDPPFGGAAAGVRALPPEGAEGAAAVFSGGDFDASQTGSHRAYSQSPRLQHRNLSPNSPVRPHTSQPNSHPISLNFDSIGSRSCSLWPCTQHNFVSTLGGGDGGRGALATSTLFTPCPPLLAEGCGVSSVSPDSTSSSSSSSSFTFVVCSAVPPCLFLSCPPSTQASSTLLRLPPWSPLAPPPFLTPPACFALLVSAFLLFAATFFELRAPPFAFLAGFSLLEVSPLSSLQKPASLSSVSLCWLMSVSSVSSESESSSSDSSRLFLFVPTLFFPELFFCDSFTFFGGVLCFPSPAPADSLGFLRLTTTSLSSLLISIPYIGGDYPTLY